MGGIRPSGLIPTLQNPSVIPAGAELRGIKPDFRITETAYTPPDKTALAEFIASLKETERDVIKSIARESSSPIPSPVSDAAIDAINGAFYERFGDLLIETGPEGPSISAEYEEFLFF